MKNTTTLHRVVDTPDENTPTGDVHDKLQQLLAEPAAAPNKQRKRGKLAKATVALPDDLVDAQERFAIAATDPLQRSFAGDDADPNHIAHDRGRGILILEGSRYLADGTEEKCFPCIDKDTPYSDTSNGMLRIYKMVQWDPEVRTYVNETYGAELAARLWANSLEYYGLQKDGLYVKEYPLYNDPVTDDEPPKGGRGGGGGGGKRPPKPPTWFKIAATPVRLDSFIKDERGIWTVELSFYNLDVVQSAWETALIPLAQLYDEGNGSAWKNLQGRGLLFGADKKAPQKFRQMVQDFYSELGDNPSQYLQLGRSKPGWHTLGIPKGKNELEDTRVYVAPGFSTHPNVRFTGSEAMKWSRLGDKDVYYTRLAQTLHNNPIVALICGWTVAGILVSEFDEIDHNPILSVLGESSIGKSLAVQTAASMRGNHEVLLKNMDATANTMKERMRAFSGVGGAIDEIGSGERMDLQQKIQAIYQWGSGDTKGRLQRDGMSGRYEEPSSDRTRYTLMLTGENSFVDMNSVPGGNQVRLSQIVFTKEQPLWHSIASNQEAEAWRGFINRNYGHLYPNLVHLVAKELPRYKRAYAKHYEALSANIQDPKERRKANAWALAMTGATLLADELHKVLPLDAQNEDEDYVPGFNHEDVLVVRQHALRLLTAELDSTPIQTESEKYMDFLEGLPSYYYADLVTDGGDLRGNPKGSYTVRTVQGDGAHREHTLCIITSHFDHMCGGKVDKTRLLRWAQETGKLVTHKESNGVDAKGNPKTVERQTSKVKIQNSGRSTCYQFVWKEQLTKEIDFNTH